MPAKLVKQTLKLDVVDMVELLNDNMEAERRLKNWAWTQSTHVHQLNPMGSAV